MSLEKVLSDLETTLFDSLVTEDRATTILEPYRATRAKWALMEALHQGGTSAVVRVGSIYKRKGYDTMGQLARKVDESRYRKEDEDLFISIAVRVPWYLSSTPIKDYVADEVGYQEKDAQDEIDRQIADLRKEITTKTDEIVELQNKVFQLKGEGTS